MMKPSFALFVILFLIIKLCYYDLSMVKSNVLIETVAARAFSFHQFVVERRILPAYRPCDTLNNYLLSCA